jgi:hypothetical protein
MVAEKNLEQNRILALKKMSDLATVEYVVTKSSGRA